MARKPQPLEPYLDNLRDYFQKCHVLPSYAEMQEMFGVTSRGVAEYFVKKLKAAGYLETTCNKHLAPTRKFFERSWPGSVRAGFPTPATEALGDSISIDDYLVAKPSATILVTVKGDSMVDAAILPGDILIVERRPRADPGDIVVAIVDNEFTVKTLKRHPKLGFFLHPENPNYPDIFPDGSLEIFGVMVGLFRKNVKD